MSAGGGGGGRGKTTVTYEWACSGEVDSTSVLAAVEAGPAAPVRAVRAASTAAVRTGGGLVVARKQARPKPRTEFHDGVSS